MTGMVYKASAPGTRLNAQALDYDVSWRINGRSEAVPVLHLRRTRSARFQHCFELATFELTARDPQKQKPMSAVKTLDAWKKEQFCRNALAAVKCRCVS
jgi:hypothetical protein